mmetsp:Transcript_30861/g.49480  ORF Transcript_30861/g.49480 Transcript_30861/m.49480 type:complete len:227 (-) Transcript_30861:9-689(-)
MQINTSAEKDEVHEFLRRSPKSKKGIVNMHRRHSTIHELKLVGPAMKVYQKNWRSAGIVCTLGPGSQDVSIMENLVEAGLDVARFNFSHGSHEYHGKLMKNIRLAARNIGRMVALALDTKGPEIRTGTFIDEEVELKLGGKVVVTVDEKFSKSGTADKFWVTYKDLPKSVSRGKVIFIDDGLLALEVEKVDGDDVHCVIKNGGMISNRKGVNLPQTKVTLPALSEG